jgi:hypothetical protein
MHVASPYGHHPSIVGTVPTCSLCGAGVGAPRSCRNWRALGRRRARAGRAGGGPSQQVRHRVPLFDELCFGGPHPGAHVLAH